MSRVISQMLDQPEHIIKRVITKLEDKNGYPSHDARLIAENIHKMRRKISELKLDPDDTTAEELYHALLVRFQKDSLEFDSQFGADIDKFEQKAAKAESLVSKIIGLPEVWVLNTSTAKALLRRHPPKKIMKQLNYRSIDSLLKREDLAELYLAISFVESDAWSKVHGKLVSALDTTSFEVRSLTLRSLSYSKWGELAPQLSIARTDEFGVLGLLPSKNLNQSPLLSMVVLLMDELANFKNLNISQQAAKLSPAVAWWEDMDSLIAGLGGEHVSMNLKDVSANRLAANNYEQRDLAGSRRSFWNELLSRYANQLEIEEDKMLDFGKRLNNLQTPINQPAFEFAQDI